MNFKFKPVFFSLGLVISTVSAFAQVEVSRGNSGLKPMTAPKDISEDTTKEAAIITVYPPIEPAKSDQKSDKYIYWKDTLYTTSYIFNPDLFIEKYKEDNKSGKKYKEKVELVYTVNSATKDTARAYGDGWDDKFVFDKQMRYQKLYTIFPISGTHKDSAYLVCNYYYNGNQLTHKVHYNLDGSFSARQEYKYDTLGNLVYENYIVTDELGATILRDGSNSHSLYKYINKELAEEHLYEYQAQANQFVLTKIKKTYLDDQQKIIRKEIWDVLNNAKISETAVSYPSSLEEKKRSNSYGSISKNETIFNKNGNVEVSMSINDNSIETTTYSYKYDKSGNWIQCIEVHEQQNLNGEITPKKVYVTKRTLTY